MGCNWGDEMAAGAHKRDRSNIHRFTCFFGRPRLRNGAKPKRDSILAVHGSEPKGRLCLRQCRRAASSAGVCGWFTQEIQSCRRGTAQGQDVTYVTERCVMKLTPAGIVVTEIAPGVDLQQHVLGQSEFALQVAPNLKVMDAALFRPEPIGLQLHD